MTIKQTRYDWKEDYERRLKCPHKTLMITRDTEMRLQSIYCEDCTERIYTREWGKTRKAVYKDTVKKIFADLEEDMVYKPDFMQGAILYKGTKVSYQALKKKYGVEDAKSV